jgi:thiamine-phosphate pyrophosphorylase
MSSVVNIAQRLGRLNKHLPALWLMTDAVRLKDPAGAVRALPRGAGVIVRHTDDRARRALAEQLAPLCRQRGLKLLIAGDWRLAARVKADGLHLSERISRIGVNGAALLWQRKAKRILTTAAHNIAAMIRGTHLGADAVILAPVFTTASHPNAPTLGATRFAALVRKVSCPVIALGGITAQTASRLLLSGARGIAGIGWSKR